MVKLLSFLLILIFLPLKIYAQSQESLDSLLLLEKSLPEGAEKIKILVFIGFNYSRISKEKAKRYYKKAISLGEKIDENVYTSSSYSQIANFYNNLGEIDSADYFLEKARIKAEKANQNVSWASYYQNQTLINKKRKNYKEAIESGKKSLQYNLIEGKKANIAGSYLNLGNCYMELKDFESSADYYYKALKIFEEINHENGKSFCYTNLGNIYKELKQHEESIKYAEISLKLKQKANDELGIGTTYLLISENYSMLKNYKAAIEYADKSINIYKKLDIAFGLVNNYQLKARIYTNMRDTIQAIKYFDLALEKAKKVENSKLINQIQLEKMALTPEKKISQNTTLDIENNLEASKEGNDINSQLSNLDYLIQFYYKNKNYKKAFDYQTEYFQLQNTIYGPDILKKIKERENRFELEKKETEIQLLEKDKELRENQLQKQKLGIYAAAATVVFILLFAYLLFNQNKIIQKKKRQLELETMRHNIAGDLHDDIGSTLSSIQIISSLALNKCSDNQPLQQSIQQINELSDKVATGIREIIWSVNPAYDKLGAVIQQMRKLAVDVLSTNEIAFKLFEDIKDPEKEFTPQQRKDLLMIFKEALNNSRKYSGTERVDIHIRQKAQMLCVQIKDYGCGFNTDDIKRGNGLCNMERRAMDINAKFNLHTKPGKGTFISIEMPLP